MSETPKERLQRAANRLAGAAEKLEETICPLPARYDPNHRETFGDPKDAIPSDSLPQAIKNGLKEVRQYADEIEEITK